MVESIEERMIKIMEKEDLEDELIILDIKLSKETNPENRLLLKNEINEKVARLKELRNQLASG